MIESSEQRPVGLFRRLRNAAHPYYRPLYYDLVPWLRRGAARVRPARGASRSLVTTVLTYKRPDCLHRTLDTLFALNDCFRTEFPVVVLVQGERGRETDETEAVLEELVGRWRAAIDVQFSDGNLGCGGGYSELLRRAAVRGSEYILHLEDDWASAEPLDQYLDELFEAFEADCTLGSIRLRSIDEPVKQHNFVTRRALKYRRLSERVSIGNGHLTFNPTIARTSALQRIIPVADEYDAMKKYHLQGWRTGQLEAGCFVHIGDERVESWKA